MALVNNDVAIIRNKIVNYTFSVETLDYKTYRRPDSRFASRE
jgi:hypothetical protein